MPTSNFEQTFEVIQHTIALCTKEELEFIYETVRDNNIETAVELGSYCGASSIAILDAGVQRLHCIDAYIKNFDAQPNTGKSALEKFSHFVLRRYDNVFLHPTYTWKAIDLVPDFDFLFIDAGHKEEDVMVDCELYLPKLKSGGFVMIHDYTNKYFPGVRKAADKHLKNYLRKTIRGSIIVGEKP